MKNIQLFILFLICNLQLGAQIKDNKPSSKWTPASFDSVLNLRKGEFYLPFEATTPDGRKLNNDSFKGKVTLIHFWFESCSGCRQEFPEVNELFDKMSKNPDFAFIAITYDAIETLPDFIKVNKIRFPVATVSDFDFFGNLRYSMACPSFIILEATGRIGFIGMHTVTTNSNDGLNMSMNKIIEIANSLK